MVMQTPGRGPVVPSKSARKAADQAFNSVTVANDSDLVIALEANAVYEFQAHLYLTGLTNGGIKLTFTVPSGATGAYYLITTDAAASGVNLIYQTAITNTTTYAAGAFSNTAASMIINFKVVNGSTPGNLTAQFGQQTAVSTMTVQKDSNIVGWRLL